MNVPQMIGLAAVGLVTARHLCRAVTGSSFGTLLIEGVKHMLTITDTSLKHCVDWNIRERDKYQARTTRAQNPLTRAEAIRNVRRHQRNIDNLNRARRQLDRSN
jgi:hypothetical protein